MLLLLFFSVFIYLLHKRKCPVIVMRVWFTSWTIILVAISCILCTPLRIAADKRWMDRRRAESISCVFSGILLGKVLWCLCPHIHVKFMEGSLDWRGIENGGIFCETHSSFFDTLIFLWICPLQYIRQVKTFAKKSLWNLPLMGHVIRACGHLPVYFTSQEAHSFSVDKEKQAAVTAAAESFLASGGTLCFFPEGVMNRTPEKLEDFRHGTFNMIVKQGLPIHYMVCFGCHEVWNPRDKRIPGFPVDIYVYIGKYEYDNRADSVEVATKLRETMQGHLNAMLTRRSIEKPF